MTYRPKFRRQIGDPTTSYDAYECTFSSGAMALDYHTLGKIQVWGGQLLARAKLTSSDIKDGTRLQQVQRAWKTYGQILDIRTGGDWNDVRRALGEGRGVILQIDHGDLSASERCSTFMGSHAVYLNPEMVTGETLMGNPLCASFKWADNGHLRRAAEALGRQAGLRPETRLDGQPIFFAVTRARPVSSQPPDTSTGGGNKPVSTGGNVAIRYCQTRTTSSRMSLKKGQVLYVSPGGARVTAMSADGKPFHVGPAGSVGGKAWRAVIVSTKWSYKDGVPRPTVLYVPASAGTVVPA